MEVGVTNKILYFDTLDDAEHDIISQFVTPFLLFANVLQFNEDKTQEAVHNQKNICEKFDCPCLFFSLLFPNCFIIDKYSISTQSYFVNPYSEEEESSENDSDPEELGRRLRNTALREQIEYEPAPD